MKLNENKLLHGIIDDAMDAVDTALSEHPPELVLEETGMITFAGQGIVRVNGLPTVKSQELLRFPGNLMGLAFNLDPEEVGVVLMDESTGINAGSEVRRTRRVQDIPVGEALIGRVIDALGRPIDGKGPLRVSQRMPVERDAPAIMDRAPVNVPLQTGLKVVDALIPIGRGQRELILGDRQTGKTAIAIDAIINQQDKDVVCIYCAIGQRSSSISKVIDDLRQYGAIDETIIIASSEKDPPGQRYIAPYAAMTIAEFFRDRGDDALIVLDDLTKHARAYREISLLLRRPPGREAYPGDIFFIHSRLLERSTHLKEELGGGSLTALPIIETEAQNLSAYIPTNLISITDGQIYLSPQLFQQGVMPAVDVGKSVSRVGGKTQLPAYRAVAGDLRLSYSQFKELESFSRFGTRLDEETRQKLARGRRVREILNQQQYQPLPVPEQIAALFAVIEGMLDEVPTEKISKTEKKIRRIVVDEASSVCRSILEGEKLSDENRQILKDVISKVIKLEGKQSEKDKE